MSEEGVFFSKMKRDMILIKKKLVDFHFPQITLEIFLKMSEESTWEKTGPFVRWQNLRNMREIQYELWFSNTSKVSSRSRWPEISVKMVRWDMAKPRHVFHRIGMISIYRGQQHKRICWFCQGVPNSPLPYRTQDLLIKSFLGVKIDVVYPMTLEECKGHTRSARIELQDI